MACCMFQSPVGVHLLQLRATMRMEAVPLGSDVVVVIATRPADTPTLILETNPNHTHAAVALSFVPRFLTAPCPPEVPTHLLTSPPQLVFVVDRSGSMAGSRIAHARDSLTLILRSLPLGCRFNIVGFGSRFEWAWPTHYPTTSTA
mmetsp:Transcript_55420/g.120786  ORF Transcript_55420/g.120786 Transcript_55420/m.120786 type:complete len:146 (-) Transcript_55420:282-719(-)